MKYVKLFAWAMLVALASTARAAAIESIYTINLEGTGDFGHSFLGADKKGQSFFDIYNFTVSSNSEFDTALISIATNTKYDLNITSFDLYSGSTLIAKGNPVATGALDVWSLSGRGISSGSYSMQVGGTILGSMGGAYGGNANVSPIPEPGTWSMFGLGIAAVAFVAKRRKSTSLSIASP